MILLLSFCFSANFCTHHLGELVKYEEFDDEIIVYTKENILAMIEKNTGEILWRQIIHKVVTFNINGPFVVVGAKHFNYVLDKETGLILYQYHTINNVKEITIGGKNYEDIVVKSNNELAMFKKDKIIWKAEINEDDKGLKILSDTDNEMHSLACGKHLYNLEDGKEIGENKINLNKDAKIELRWSPTAFEAYNESGLIWRIDEPLQGSNLVTAISKSKILLKNKTHLLVYDVISQELSLSKKCIVYSVVNDKKGVFINTNEGIYLLNPKDLMYSLYEDKKHLLNFGNKTIKIEKSMFSFPSECEIKNTAICGHPSSFIAVAQCNKFTVVSIINDHGSVKYMNQIEANASTCWCSENNALISYYKPKQKISYVSSFSLINNSQRSFTTEALVVAADKDAFALANGDLVNLKSTIKISGNSPIGQVSIMSNDFYEPDIKQLPKIAASFEGVKAISKFGDNIFIQNKDIYHFQESLDFSSMNLLAVGFFFVLALGLYVNSFRSRKTSFWK